MSRNVKSLGILRVHSSTYMTTMFIQSQWGSFETPLGPLTDTAVFAAYGRASDPASRLSSARIFSFDRH